jgi:cell division protein FtsL
MRKDRSPGNSSHPIIRFRSMMVGVGLIALLISGPLLLVWKQVYITDTSLKLNAMADTLASLEKQVAALRLTRERLSSTERIELFARNALQLDYPSSDQIVIVPNTINGSHSKHGPAVMLSYVRKLFTRGRV